MLQPLAFRSTQSKFLVPLFLMALSFGSPVVAAELDIEDLLTRAKATYADGKIDAAILLATKAMEAKPSDARPDLVRAQFYEQSRELPKALTDHNEAVKLDPKLARAWQLRGLVHFKLAQIDESIADFDRFIELMPDQARYHWQRGISY